MYATQSLMSFSALSQCQGQIGFTELKAIMERKKMRLSYIRLMMPIKKDLRGTVKEYKHERGEQRMNVAYTFLALSDSTVWP